MYVNAILPFCYKKKKKSFSLHITHNMFVNTSYALSNTLPVLSLSPELSSSYRWKKTHKAAAGGLVWFTDEASSNSLSCAYMSGRTPVPPRVLHYTLSAGPVWLPAGAIRQRGLTSLKADVNVFIRAAAAAQSPFNTAAYLALFHARCIVEGLCPHCGGFAP